MKDTIIYAGLFVNDFIIDELANIIREELGYEALERYIPNKHITTAFRPNDLGNTFTLGECVYFDIIGYANDGINEAFLVDVPKLNIDTPHITLSVSKDGKPVNSKNLKFKMLSQKRRIAGYYGYFNGTSVVKGYN